MNDDWLGVAGTEPAKLAPPSKFPATLLAPPTKLELMVVLVPPSKIPATLLAPPMKFSFTPSKKLSLTMRDVVIL